MAVEMCFVMYDSHVTDVDVLFLFIFLLMIHEGVRRNTLSLYCTPCGWLLAVYRMYLIDEIGRAHV